MNQPLEHINLTNIVPSDFLIDLLTKFSYATGVKTLISDYTGHPIILPDLPRNFCRFCEEVRNIPEFRKECERSDAFGGIIASQQAMPHIYKCYMGMVEVAVPIIIEKNYMGLIMIGQIRVLPEEYEELDRIAVSNININDYPKLQKIYNDTVEEDCPQIPLERLTALSNMLHYIANYIAEISMNSYLQKINDDLKMQILREENYKSELEKNIKSIEFQNLQKNLNPRFLFNTLTAINNLVILENTQLASDIISALSQFLRRGFISKGKHSDVRQEYETVKDFLKLWNISSGKNLPLEVDIEESCLEAMMPPFTLQPLIENAFRYGVKDQLDGVVSLRIFKTADKINIIISDNGVGMQPTLLLHLIKYKNSGVASSALKETTLFKIICIMSYYFEGEFNWEIKSEEGKGMSVNFVIPFLKNEETEVRDD